MADFTLHDSHSSSSGSSSSSAMSVMDHGPASMSMIFFTSTSTPLFSVAWTPKSTGSYVGTCSFLIILGIIYRGLHAYTSITERRWAKAARSRIIVVATKGGVENDGGNRDSGESGPVRIPTNEEDLVRTWRWSTDLPRATLLTILNGTGYLLMLAVMTMNVGYFLSVLAGIFMGELAFGFLRH